MSEMVKTPGGLDAEIAAISDMAPVAHRLALADTPGVVVGSVRGAWSILHFPSAWKPAQAFFLPAGQEMQMPDDTAIFVMDDNRWALCNFPQSGYVKGPLLWSEVEPSSHEMLLRGAYAKCGEMCAISGVCGATLTIILGTILASTYDSVVAGLGVASVGLLLSTFGLSAIWLKWKAAGPLTIKGVNQRVDMEPRMLDSMVCKPNFAAEMIAPDTATRREADAEVATSLQGYHAQRQRLTSIGMPRNSMVDHTASMLDDLYQRLQAVSHQTELRQTFLSLIERAEAEVVRLIEKKEAREIKALEGDMKALLMQIERHPA